MSDTSASLSRKISTAGDLQSVVRTMKALAASSIGQYEKAVSALGDYTRTVELGLGAAFRLSPPAGAPQNRSSEPASGGVGAVVFGSDQGLVGQFNDIIADYAIEALAALPGPPQVWAVGERVHARLEAAGLAPRGLFAVPSSVAAITPLVRLIQLESEAHQATGGSSPLHLFHHQPQTGGRYQPTRQRLLPLDAAWQTECAERDWPTPLRPEMLGGTTAALRGLIREHLFISLFRACAESLASENASRLAAMQRAEQNIDALLTKLHQRFHQLRQSSIDAELFDVIAGGEAAAPDRS